MKVLACQRDDCPLERTRVALNAFREKRTAEGVAVPQSTNDFVMSCVACGMTRGWVHYADGTEREIDQSVIWGREANTAR